MLLCCSLLQACSALNLKLCERTTVRAIAASVGGKWKLPKMQNAKQKKVKCKKNTILPLLRACCGLLQVHTSHCEHQLWLTAAGCLTARHAFCELWTGFHLRRRDRQDSCCPDAWWGESQHCWSGAAGIMPRSNHTRKQPVLVRWWEHGWPGIIHGFSLNWHRKV